MKTFNYFLAFFSYVSVTMACASKRLPTPEASQVLEQKIVVKNEEGRFSFLSVLSRSASEVTVRAFDLFLRPIFVIRDPFDQGQALKIEVRDRRLQERISIIEEIYLRMKNEMYSKYGTDFNAWPKRMTFELPEGKTHVEIENTRSGF